MSPIKKFWRSLFDTEKQYFEVIHFFCQKWGHLSRMESYFNWYYAVTKVHGEFFWRAVVSTLDGFRSYPLLGFEHALSATNPRFQMNATSWPPGSWNDKTSFEHENLHSVLKIREKIFFSSAIRSFKIQVLSNCLGHGLHPCIRKKLILLSLWLMHFIKVVDLKKSKKSTVWKSNSEPTTLVLPPSTHRSNGTLQG